MRIFIESIDRGIWNTIVNGPYIPVHVIDGVSIVKPFDELSDLENKRVQYDCIAKNIITSALNMDEFFRISQCSSAKEMWDVLEVTHEGTTDVKRARKHTLIQEYEMFRMQPGESIVDVQKRFTHITNHLIGLGKQFDKEELNIKILKCLDRSWQPKVTAISETKDLTVLTTAALFGKLREHELEMTRLKELESTEKRSRSLALKSKVAETETSENSSEENSETENLNLLVRRFNRFIKLKNRSKNQQNKRYSKKSDSSFIKLTCFGCGKTGHMKADCPNLSNMDKPTERKNYKAGKTRKAYIAWEDNASTSSSSSKENEEANLCLMAGEDSEVSSVNSDDSFESTNSSSLLNAFHETLEEANRLACSNKRLKGLNNWLEARVKELENEVLNLKTDFENYKTSSNLNSSKPVNCENCEVLQEKVKYLITTSSKLTMGTANLNAILGTQNCVFERAGIGYQPNFPRKQKKYSSFFKSSTRQFSQPITCFYCMKRGHSVRDCKFRKFYVPEGSVRWMPKTFTNKGGPKINWVPIAPF